MSQNEWEMFYYIIMLLDTSYKSAVNLYSIWVDSALFYISKSTSTMHPTSLFAGLDNNRAVCDFGIKEFNHELVLQPVEEVNVPHPWSIIGEYMGDLYT